MNLLITCVKYSTGFLILLMCLHFLANSKAPETNKDSIYKDAAYIKAERQVQEELIKSKLAWQYITNTDALTNKSTIVARRLSVNTFDFNSPYQNSKKAFIEVSNNNEVGVGFDSMQLLCHTDDCNMMVKFDNEEPVSIRFIKPSDYSTDWVGTRDRYFINKLKTAKKVLVQFETYKNGQPIAEFNLTDLDLKRLNVK